MTEILSHFQGIVPILPTPFKEDESIDEAGFENILAFAKISGCTTVGVPAFGSEFYKLSEKERMRILDLVFKHANGLNIIVQCNHASPKIVQELIKDAEIRGAVAINTALPRAMAVSENQLLGYVGVVCASTNLPVIIQDYNPGGAVIGLDFVKRISEEFLNFKFIKYEAPGLGALIKNIINATQEKVNVFSGWGGSYMLEQIPAGIAGIMPGIPLADYFVKIWNYASSGNLKDAMKMFVAISPYLSFSLQNLEMFHHAEKRLAVRRHIMKSSVVRSIKIELDEFQEKYLALVLDQTCDAIEEHGFKLKLN